MSNLLNRQIISNKTPTNTASVAYVASDVIGGLMTINCESRPSGTLRRIVVIDDDDVKTDIDLYFFTDEPTAIADADNFAPTVADLKNLIGKVSIAAADYTSVNSNAYAIKTGVDIDFIAPTAFNLYCYAVVTGTPTFTTTTALTFRFGFWLD